MLLQCCSARHTTQTRINIYHQQIHWFGRAIVLSLRLVTLHYRAKRQPATQTNTFRCGYATIAEIELVWWDDDEDDNESSENHSQKRQRWNWFAFAMCSSSSSSSFFSLFFSLFGDSLNRLCCRKMYFSLSFAPNLTSLATIWECVVCWASVLASAAKKERKRHWYQQRQHQNHIQQQQ